MWSDVSERKPCKQRSLCYDANISWVRQGRAKHNIGCKIGESRLPEVCIYYSAEFQRVGLQISVILHISLTFWKLSSNITKWDQKTLRPLWSSFCQFNLKASFKNIHSNITFLSKKNSSLWEHNDPNFGFSSHKNDH